MRRAVLVNGVPASGKSSAAERLTEHLQRQGIAAVPLALDRVKEALFDHLGAGDREHNRQLGRASYQSLFATIAAFPDALVPVVDVWFGFQPKPVLVQHLSLARIDLVVELWCDVSPAVAAERYRRRAASRPAGHPPADYADELAVLAKTAAPMALGPVVRLDAERAATDDSFDAILRLLQS